MSNWRECKIEAKRKQAIVVRGVMQLRQQQIREQNANKNYYGDNLK